MNGTVTMETIGTIGTVVKANSFIEAITKIETLMKSRDISFEVLVKNEKKYQKYCRFIKLSTSVLMPGKIGEVEDAIDRVFADATKLYYEKGILTVFILDEKEILFVVLYADYNSIYRQFPDHQRRRKAMFHAFNEDETDIIESARVQMAVEDYISLQYSPKIETARKYQQKIDRLLQNLDDEESPTQIKKITDAISQLRDNIRNLEKEIDEQVITEGVIKGNMTLSHLEKIQSNPKIYHSIKAKR